VSTETPALSCDRTLGHKQHPAGGPKEIGRLTYYPKSRLALAIEVIMVEGHSVFFVPVQLFADHL